MIKKNVYIPIGDEYETLIFKVCLIIQYLMHPMSHDTKILYFFSMSVYRIVTSFILLLYTSDTNELETKAVSNEYSSLKNFKNLSVLVLLTVQMIFILHKLLNNGM